MTQNIPIAGRYFEHWSHTTNQIHQHEVDDTCMYIADTQTSKIVFFFLLMTGFCLLGHIHVYCTHVGNNDLFFL